jgi:hypothetical protein
VRECRTALGGTSAPAAYVKRELPARFIGQLLSPYGLANPDLAEYAGVMAASDSSTRFRHLAPLQLLRRRRQAAEAAPPAIWCTLQHHT